MSRLLKLCIVLGTMLFGLAFHLRNDQFITLDYYAGGIDLPFSLWFLVALTLGAGLGVLAGFPTILRYKRENSRLSRRLKLCESELSSLRTMPAQDTGEWNTTG